MCEGLEGKYNCLSDVLARALAQWLALGADDFWYPSMRKPPKPAAARVPLTNRNSSPLQFGNPGLLHCVRNDEALTR